MNEDAAQATPLGFQISPGRAFMTTDGKPERDLTCLSPRPGEGDEKAQGESVRVHAFGYGGAVERTLDIGVDSMQGVAPEGGVGAVLARCWNLSFEKIAPRRGGKVLAF